MSKNTASTKQTDLETLYSTNDMTLLKNSIAELVDKQDYKTLNTLFRRNPNASKFDTRTLNEDVPQQTKRFTKRNGKLCNVARTIPRKQTSNEANDIEYTYKTRLYDPNTKSHVFVDKPMGSRIRSRY